MVKTSTQNSNAVVAALDGPERTLRELLAPLGEAILELAAGGEVTWFNRTAARLLGDRAAVAPGQPLEEILPLDGESTRQPLAVEQLSEEERVCLAGVPHRLYGVRRLTLAGPPPRTWIVLRDLDGGSAAFNSLPVGLHQQLLSRMAHDLRNPLASIRNAAEFLKQLEPVNPGVHSVRVMVERQVQQLARAVDELLDLTRLTGGGTRLREDLIDLRAVVERAAEAARPLIEMRSHQLSLALPERPLMLRGDPARLEQLVASLLENAARYTMPNGAIWLALKVVDGAAELRVRDNGIGLLPDVRRKILAPLDESVPPTSAGPGLGLTLVRTLAELHGGTVEARSAGLGQGSEFIVRLPIRGGASGEAEPAFSDGHGIRVLIVEDNVDAAESLAQLLRLWDYEVSVVHHGQAALEVARAERPHAVLLDLGLPGIDGYQVARRLRREVGLHETLLVAMTGYGQPEDLRRSREAGIQYHFVKPVEPLVLRRVLAECSAVIAH